MADQVEASQDGTEGFEITLSDAPVVENEEAKAPNELANSEEQAKAPEASNTGDDDSASMNAADEPVTESEAPAPKKKNGVQKRISKITREREESRREAEALRKELEELKGSKSEGKAEGTAEPKEDDYDTYDEYVDALDVYDGKQQVAAEPKKEPVVESKKADAAPEMTQSQQDAMSVLKERVGAAESLPEDFNEVALNESVPITNEMIEALAECDDPTKVMYHLGQNAELAGEIASGSPAQQAREIAKLDFSVDVKPAKPIQQSKAPDPIEPVRGVDAQQKSIDDMPFEEYEAYMNKQEGLA